MQYQHGWQVYRNGRPITKTISPPNTPLWPGSPMIPTEGAIPFGTTVSLRTQDGRPPARSDRQAGRQPEA